MLARERVCVSESLQKERESERVCQRESVCVSESLQKERGKVSVCVSERACVCVSETSKLNSIQTSNLASSNTDFTFKRCHELNEM